MKIDKPMIERADTTKPNHFSRNTDSVDIDAKSLGVHLNLGYADRGLSIQIRHCRHKELFDTSVKMQEIIIEALNRAVDEGRLVLP